MGRNRAPHRHLRSQPVARVAACGPVIPDGSATVQPQLPGAREGVDEGGDRSERRLVNRELQTLPLKTRIRLTNGRTATLVALTFTSATVKIDPGQPPDRRANGRGEVEIAPAAEVDLLERDHGPTTDCASLTTGGLHTWEMPCRTRRRPCRHDRRRPGSPDSAGCRTPPGARPGPARP